MNKTLASAKNFWAKNKTRILITATVLTTTAVVIQHKALMSHNEFLKENDLFDTYYAEDDE